MTLGIGLDFIGMGAFTPVVAASSNTFNPSDAQNAVLSNGNLSFTTNTVGNATVRSITKRTSGKWYWEFSWNGGADVFLSCGILTSASSLTLPGSYLGGTTNSVGFGKNAQTIFNDVFTNSGLGTTVGHVYGAAVDLTAERIWFRNATSAPSTWWGSASGDPAAGTNGLDYSASTGTEWCVAAAARSDRPAVLTVNLGGSAFVASAPSGFSAWG